MLCSVLPFMCLAACVCCSEPLVLFFSDDVVHLSLFHFTCHVLLSAAVWHLCFCSRGLCHGISCWITYVAKVYKIMLLILSKMLMDSLITYVARVPY